MKRNLMLLFAAIVVLSLSSCAQDKNTLIVRSWKCDKILGLDQRFNDYVKEKSKEDNSLWNEELESTYKLLYNLQLSIKMGELSPANWVFDKNGSFPYNGGIINFIWKIDSDTLILSNEKSKYDKIVKLTIERLNENEMILNKDFLGPTVKIYFSEYENENYEKTILDNSGTESFITRMTVGASKGLEGDVPLFFAMSQYDIETFIRRQQQANQNSLGDDEAILYATSVNNIEMFKNKLQEGLMSGLNDAAFFYSISDYTMKDYKSRVTEGENNGLNDAANLYALSKYDIATFKSRIEDGRKSTEIEGDQVYFYAASKYKL